MQVFWISVYETECNARWVFTISINLVYFFHPIIPNKFDWN